MRCLTSKVNLQIVNYKYICLYVSSDKHIHMCLQRKNRGRFWHVCFADCWKLFFLQVGQISDVLKTLK